jgi:hypothetical protein
MQAMPGGAEPAGACSLRKLTNEHKKKFGAKFCTTLHRRGCGQDRVRTSCSRRLLILSAGRVGAVLCLETECACELRTEQPQHGVDVQERAQG